MHVAARSTRDDLTSLSTQVAAGWAAPTDYDDTARLVAAQERGV